MNRLHARGNLGVDDLPREQRGGKHYLARHDGQDRLQSSRLAVGWKHLSILRRGLYAS